MLNCYTKDFIQVVNVMSWTMIINAKHIESIQLKQLHYTNNPNSVIY